MVRKGEAERKIRDILPSYLTPSLPERGRGGLHSGKAGHPLPSLLRPHFSS